MDADLSGVSASLAVLGCAGPHRVLEQLTSGGSGAQVFLLELPGGQAVLKVTEDPGWRDRARRELGVYQALPGRLGVEVPAVIAAGDDHGVIRLLLAAHPPYPPVPAVTDAQWTPLAGQLGRLHRPPDPRPLWLDHRPWPTAERLQRAVGWWAARGFGTPARRAAALIATGRESDEVLPRVLTHGDCHVGNLLRSPAGITLWIDWQEVGLSSGLVDLVFLWQRAEFAGATPPRDAMGNAYLAARGPEADLDLRAALAVTELRLLLVDWPPFLPCGPQHQQDLMTDRLGQLVDELTAR